MRIKGREIGEGTIVRYHTTTGEQAIRVRDIIEDVLDNPGKYASAQKSELYPAGLKVVYDGLQHIDLEDKLTELLEEHGLEFDGASRNLVNGERELYYYQAEEERRVVQYWDPTEEPSAWSKELAQRVLDLLKEIRDNTKQEISWTTTNATIFTPSEGDYNDPTVTKDPHSPDNTDADGVVYTV